MNAPASALERLEQRLAQYAAWRVSDEPDFSAYERFKRDLDRDCPGLSHHERERAVRTIAQATGV